MRFTANMASATLIDEEVETPLSALHRHQMPRYNPSMGRYRLVDFAAHYQKGFRNHVVPITDVPALLDKFKYYGSYSSYFFYSDELLTYMSAQSATAPSVSGYEGKVWAPYLPIDLDHPELMPALKSGPAAQRFFSRPLARQSQCAAGLFQRRQGFSLDVGLPLVRQDGTGAKLADGLRRAAPSYRPAAA